MEKSTGETSSNQERFARWLANLEQNLKEIRSEKDLIGMIQQAIEKESKIFPRFLAQFSGLLEGHVSSPNSLKEHLSRIIFPRISLLLPTLKNELLNLKKEVNLKYGVQFPDDDRDYERQFTTLFSEINQSTKDPLIGFCKLADYCYRLNRAAEYDAMKLEKFVEHETTRKARNAESLSLSIIRSKYLEGKDEFNLIKKSEEKMNEEVLQLRSDMLIAQREEEEAFRIYEEARRKKREVQDNLVETETALEELTAQSELLNQINGIKVKVNSYNNESADQRLKLVTALANYLNAAKASFVANQINNDLPTIMDYLNELIKNLLTAGSVVAPSSSEIGSLFDEKQISSVHTLRVCVEAIKLFKRLTGNLDFSPSLEKLSELQSFIQSLERNLSTNSYFTPKKSASYQNSTVILYFTHVVHSTPENHVEDQQRVEKTLKLLMKLKPAFSSSVKTRSIVFEKCEKIRSPPFWCLPLVHSSQYLKRLYDFAREAKEDDLYVPLEFDTEWESQYDFTSESETEEVKRKSEQYFPFQLPPKWKNKFGEDASLLLTEVLKPEPGDFSLASFLRKNSKNTRTRRNRRETRNSMNSEKEKNEGKPAKTAPLPSTTSTLRKIRTPYGCGTIMEEKENGFVVATMDWGAVAYLNSESFEIVKAAPPPPKSATTTNVSSAEPTSTFTPMKLEARFMHTDLRLHQLLTRILSQIKVQRNILEKVDVKDAHMSLWLHGRTSSGLSRTIEGSIYKWLLHYPRAKLLEILDNREASQNESKIAPTDLEAANFLRELDAIREPEHVATFDKYFGKESFDAEKLRQEALDYSLKRLTNKSGLPRANGPRKRAKKSQEPKNISTAANLEEVLEKFSDPKFAARKSEGEKQLGKRKELKFFSEEQLLKIEAILQFLLQQVMRVKNYTQTEVSDELWRLYQLKVTQTGLSAWFHQRASNELASRLTKLTFLYLHLHKDRLHPHEQQQLYDLLKYPYFQKVYAVGKDATDLLPEKPSVPRSAPAVPAPPTSLNQIINLPQHRLLMSVPVKKKELETAPVNPAPPQQDSAKTEAVESESKPAAPDDSMEVDQGQTEDEGPLAEAGEAETNEEQEQEQEQADKMSVDSESLVSADEYEHPASPLKSNQPKEERTAAQPKGEVEEAANNDEKNDDPDENDEDDEEDTLQHQQQRNKRKREHTLKPVNPEERPYYKEMIKQEEISDGSLIALLNDLNDEINRRSLTHIYVAKEGTRLGLHFLSQPIISKFVRTRINPYLSRGNEFLTQIIRWLLYSVTKEPNYAAEDYASCSGCDKDRDFFSTKNEFLHHVGVCGTFYDTISPVTNVKEILNEEIPQIDDCFEKLLDGKMSALDNSEVINDPNYLRDACFHCKIVDENTHVCATCSRRYHENCCDTADRDAGVCDECLKVGLSTEEERASRAIAGDWLFSSFPPAFNWKRSLVLSVDPAREHIVLVKILEVPSSEKDNSQYYWIDLSKKNAYLMNITDPADKPPSNSTSTSNVKASGKQADDNNSEVEEGPKRKRRRRGDVDPSSDNEAERRNPPRRSSSSSLPFSPKSSKKDNGFDNGDDSNNNGNADVFTDTYVGPNSLKAALSAAGTVCRAIDVVMNGENVNAFACIRPPGHHCGRNGCTKGSLSTGFCLLNNAAIGLMYARVFWGLTRVAIVDIDVHFGNGTAEIVKNDPDTFFASIHMIYGPKNDGNYYDHAPNVNCGCGFYPPQQGLTEVTNNYVSVGVYPDDIFAKECVPKSFPSTSSARKSSRGGTGGGGGGATTTRSRSSNNNSSHHSSRRSNYSVTEESNNDDSDELKSISDDDESIKSLHEDAMEVEEEEKEVLIPNPLPIYSGPSGYIAGIRDVIIPKLIAFRPELLIISAGFDGCSSDPLGGEMNLSTQDYHECTTMLMDAMKRVAAKTGKSSPKIVSILEGGYDTAPETLGLAKSVEAHVKALLGV